MTPTFIGFVMLAVGFFLLFHASIEAMLAFCLIATLMGGASAITMGALGGASLLPSQFGLIFLILRIALPSARQMPLVRDGAVATSLLMLYVGYSVFSAFLLPRIFAGAMQVAPLKPGDDLRAGLFSTVALKFTTQNITASFNLTFTMLSGIFMYVAARQPRGAVTLVKVGAVICFIHSYLGISGALLARTPYSKFLQLFRNGSYFQHNQSIDGFVRITGIHPEPSGYAAYGFVWFVFMSECWLRDILRRRTGWAALIMGGILVISTSSTAYVSLAGYAVLLGLRLAIAPRSISVRKALTLVALIIAGTTAVSAMLLFVPTLSRTLLDILTNLTVNKQQSSSGLQRAFWARQGLEAFKVSHGLGIGAGSFRSSSLPTAILGSSGVVGAASFLFFVLHAFKPLRVSTYRPLGDKVSQVGAAASWVALMILVPASIGSPSPDPGFLFGAFCGVALALRGPVLQAPLLQPRERRRRAPADAAIALPY